ncbi:histidine kinase [Niabella sp. CC-SYL272]|uniref:histidine kinase n=1 Tax=Niabella agricola TaxID=2891571 RepID=UPI001F3B7812|nr:histidine kinase [Niabella agricola]MCF3110503.1 histidine kinase [Niabella agricola]
MSISCIKRLLTGLLLILFTGAAASAQSKADSWESVSGQGKGTITVLWDEIEPFIYRTKEGTLIGVEYELMEGLKTFLKKHYNVQLEINWKEVSAFEDIYPLIRDAARPGIFAVSYYSITEARKKDVRFSPPYMPDLNVLVTNNQVPVFESRADFRTQVKSLHGYTQRGTTMETDLRQLQTQYFPALPVSYDTDDYAILKRVSQTPGSMAYVPVAIYVVALQRGYKIKRQRLFDVHREGFAAIYPKNSDWEAPVTAYFNSEECHTLVASLIRKYLGEEVAAIILGVSAADDDQDSSDDIGLLTKEREIVTHRLMDAAVELERQQWYRNMTLLLLGCSVVFILLLYTRFRTKQRLNSALKQRNQLISAQNAQIDQMNRRLQLKVLQTRMNPHFLFNSLNAIQYFVMGGDNRLTLQYIKRFSGFLRKLIQFGDETVITLADEIALLKAYLWLEQSRFPDLLEYEVTATNADPNQQLLPLLTHAIVEKQLYKRLLDHGIPGKLQVQFNPGTDVLTVVITVAITGNAVPGEADVDESTSDERNSLYERIRLFNRNSKRKISVITEEHATLSTTIITVPQPLFEPVTAGSNGS